MPNTDRNIIHIDQVHYSYRAQLIFDGISINFVRGSITAIMGPSGTGKTTLLHLIGGLVSPKKGKILINKTNIVQCSSGERQKIRRTMGMLFQEGALFTDLNVFENVAFLLREHTQLPEDMIRDLVLLKLEAVGLRGAHQLKINELSGGMARRVALARAIMLDPELMMYDEPFTGQDPINRGILMKLIKELNSAFGLTSIVVSHDVREVANVADYVYVIAGGQVIAHGEVHAVMADTSPEVNQFIKGLPDGPIAFQYPANAIEKDFAL